MSFSDDLVKNDKCKSILEDILNHDIVTSLAGMTNELSRDQLVQVRNNFYLQDYFYLIYAYKVPQIFLIDSSSDITLKANLLELSGNENYDRELHNPFLLEENPFLCSSTIKKIRKTMKDVCGIQVEGNRPNIATQKYIFFRKRSTFQSDIKAIISNLPCLYVYAEFNLIFNENYGQYAEDIEFKDWIDFLKDNRNRNYYDKATKICNQLVAGVSQKSKHELKLLFLNACKLEFNFMESLL